MITRQRLLSWFFTCKALCSVVNLITLPNERDLLDRFCQGDEEAFRLLVEQCKDLIQRRIETHLPQALKRRVSISDITQEALLIAFQQRAEFHGRDISSFRAWLTKIAELKARRAVQWHRSVPKRNQGLEVTTEKTHYLQQAASVDPRPSQNLQAAETWDLVQQALAELPEDYRQILLLIREEGMSLRQAAGELRRSYAGTRKLHSRALLRFTDIYRKLRGDKDG